MPAVECQRRALPASVPLARAWNHVRNVQQLYLCWYLSAIALDMPDPTAASRSRWFSLWIAAEFAARASAIASRTADRCSLPRPH